MSDEYWYLRAACRGRHELFDSVESVGGKEFYPYLEQARDICWGREGNTECPVRAMCQIAGQSEITGVFDGQPQGRTQQA